MVVLVVDVILTVVLLIQLKVNDGTGQQTAAGEGVEVTMGTIGISAELERLESVGDWLEI